MELQVSCGVCPEIQAKSILWGKKIGNLKGKSSLMIYEKWGNMKYKYKNREFWCREYYVDTVGKNTKAINEYISHQLREDELGGS